MNQFNKLQDIKGQIVTMLIEHNVSLMPSFSQTGDFHYALIDNQTGETIAFGNGGYFDNRKIRNNITTKFDYSSQQ
ncbi:hypothetical protein ACFVS2_20295 [Brevibacillus sp. NPDC058079]|uniref:hypothetical protein n=1 Tax=Brevibacillus sp. NPDC058079 TaxID=3346330 RepID=UPI0036E32AE4